MEQNEALTDYTDQNLSLEIKSRRKQKIVFDYKRERDRGSVIVAMQV